MDCQGSAVVLLFGINVVKFCRCRIAVSRFLWLKSIPDDVCKTQ